MRCTKVNMPQKVLADYCHRNGIYRLSVFGSVLRDDFRDDSDIDVLVEFEPGQRVGYIRLGTIEGELSDLLGRKVDLKTVGGISTYFRDEVLKEAEVVYVAA